MCETSILTPFHKTFAPIGQLPSAPAARKCVPRYNSPTLTGADSIQFGEGADEILQRPAEPINRPRGAYVRVGSDEQRKESPQGDAIPAEGREVDLTSGAERATPEDSAVIDPETKA